MEIWYVIKICFGIIEMFDLFEDIGFVGNVFLYCWCVLYYKLLFLMRLSDSVYFSVYIKII